MYLSEPSSDWDSYVATAEGLPVFNLKTLNSACAAVGANITVIGEVVESNSVVPADITAADTPGTGVLPTVSMAPTSGNVIAGLGVTTVATLTPLGGFSGNVTVSCTTNATGSVCAPAQASLTLSAATQMNVAITTTAQYTVIGYGGFGGRLGWIALLSASVLMLGMLRRRKLPRLLASFALLFVLVSGLTGCGDKLPDHNEDPTYPGTYTYTLTVTDGILTHSATYSLAVTAK